MGGRVNKRQRDEYVERLVEVISAAMARNADMRREVILSGRFGLDQMSDAELIELGTGCWDIHPAKRLARRKEAK